MAPLSTLSLSSPPLPLFPPPVRPQIGPTIGKPYTYQCRQHPGNKSLALYSPQPNFFQLSTTNFCSSTGFNNLLFT